MKVLAYCVHGNLSYSVLRGVASGLESRGADVRWQFADSHMVSKSESEKTIEAEGLKLAEKSAFSPDVAIHADPRCTPKSWGCRVVEVPHGLASKIGYYLPASDIKMDVDVHLAASHWYAQRLREWFPRLRVITCGMPKLDEFLKVEKTRDHVVYAPTFTKCLTSWPFISEAAEKLAQHHKSLLRLHRVQFEMVETERPSGIEFDTSLDICGALGKAKVIVSDISSAWIEAMGLGIPVVCYLTAGGAEHLKKRPLSAEAHFIKHATVIHDATELESAIKNAMPAPVNIQSQILSYHGESVKRSTEAILGL